MVLKLYCRGENLQTKERKNARTFTANNGNGNDDDNDGDVGNDAGICK